MSVPTVAAGGAARHLLLESGGGRIRRAYPLPLYWSVGQWFFALITGRLQLVRHIFLHMGVFHEDLKLEARSICFLSTESLVCENLEI